MTRKQLASCVFDLECSSLNADFGILLCAVVKPADGEPMIFRADDHRSWRRGRSCDKALVRAVVDCLESFDVWIAHNGQRFDVPWLRTRLLKWNLPPLANRKLIDPVLLARNKLKMSFNSLGQLASLLGCNSKTDVEPDIWLKASLEGCKTSLDYIVEHCVQDVLVLEEVVTRLKHYSTNLNSYGSGY